MHPSLALLLWLIATIAVQFSGYPGLALLALVVLLVRPGVWRRWLVYLRRARWLLLTLWLILAYNTPGDTPADLAWAPTYEGMGEAALHACRLVLMLLCLAWLFDSVGRDGLVSGLWSLMRPLRRCGLNCGRLVVRLSLVLENLQTPQERGAWKRMLAGDPAFAGGPDVLHVEQPVWQTRDVRLLLVGLIFLLGIGLL